MRFVSIFLYLKLHILRILNFYNLYLTKNLLIDVRTIQANIVALVAKYFIAHLTVTSLKSIWNVQRTFIENV